jgi:hypothetical protein
MSMNTAGTGGMVAPAPDNAPPALVGPAMPQMPMRSPDDSPNLTDPTNRPDEPITSGSDFGPGPDSSSLGLQSYSQQRQGDVDTLKKMLPELQAATKFEGAPATFTSLVNYLTRL